MLGSATSGKRKDRKKKIQVVKSILVIALSLAKSKNTNDRYSENAVLQFVSA